MVGFIIAVFLTAFVKMTRILGFMDQFFNGCVPLDVTAVESLELHTMEVAI
jgi:hypothetical protein